VALLALVRGRDVTGRLAGDADSVVTGRAGGSRVGVVEVRRAPGRGGVAVLASVGRRDVVRGPAADRARAGASMTGDASSRRARHLPGHVTAVTTHASMSAGERETRARMIEVRRIRRCARGQTEIDRDGEGERAEREQSRKSPRAATHCGSIRPSHAFPPRIRRAAPSAPRAKNLQLQNTAESRSGFVRAVTFRSTPKSVTREWILIGMPARAARVARA